jgi:multiple sugar transport system substrate-binding protein
MTTWPAKDPKKSDYMKPGQFLSVSASAKDPVAAVKFINWWTNDVECNTTLKAERGIPLSSKVAEAVAPKLDASTAEIASFLNNVVAPNSSQINPPSGNGTSEVNDLLNKLEEQVCYGQMTAEEAGKQLFEQGNKIMAEKAAAK